MKRVGSGTQKVEQELFDLFPKAKVLRMDADTVGASRGHEALLREFEEKNIPILLGTQMVAKGLDFENVTLVGVLDADLSPLRAELPRRRADVTAYWRRSSAGPDAASVRAARSSRPTTPK